MIDWWNEPCAPEHGCATAFMQGNIIVWPVWQNQNDPSYFTFKVHHLTPKSRWERISGRLCAHHQKRATEEWWQSLDEDIVEMERTDRWAIKNGGRQ